MLGGSHAPWRTLCVGPCRLPGFNTPSYWAIPRFVVLPKEVKEHEGRLRPEPTSRVAARKIAERLGYRLEERRLKLATMAVRYGMGVTWGPIYSLLRRQTRMGPLPAALATGAAMSLVLDEMLVPALGLSPAPQAFPATTHIRGLLNHLVYGAAAALAAETVYRLTGTTPGQR